MAEEASASGVTDQPTTKRLDFKKQSLDDAYAAPANLLEIEVGNADTHGLARNRYTDYEVKMRTNIPIFKLKDSSVRRRYRDFEWLKKELERDSKIVVPALPGKALKRQLPFRGGDGVPRSLPSFSKPRRPPGSSSSIYHGASIFEDDFIEERMKGLEEFINKISGHPLAQNERCLHMFLQEPVLDRSYVPGKVRSTN